MPKPRNLTPQPAPNSTQIKRENTPQQRNTPTAGHPVPMSNGNGIAPQMAPAPPHWEPNISNAPTFDAVSRKMCEFIFTSITSHQSIPPECIEVEGKIGTLIDKTTGERIRLPIETETVLVSNALNPRFESLMDEQQHRILNKFLNEAVQKSHRKIPEPHMPQRIPIAYKHLREVDTFYSLNRDSFEYLPPFARDLVNPNHTTKLRVTREQKSGKITARIVKTRIADLDVFCPQDVFDLRISINVEMEYDGPLDGLPPAYGRSKDRMSYKHQACSIDLTQVTDMEDKAKPKTHELEVELSSQDLLHEVGLAQQNLPNHFEPMVNGFVSNLRNLLRSITMPQPG